MKVNTNIFTYKDRICRCKGCKYAIIAPIVDANEPPDMLYCKLMEYPCNRIIICDVGKQ